MAKTCMDAYTGLHPSPPAVNIRANSERFGSNAVTLILEWTQENSYSYNISAAPQVAIRSIGSTSVQLAVPYNTLLNVSITALLCGQKHATTSITLVYSEVF